jgi:hypothetical protein
VEATLISSIVRQRQEARSWKREVGSRKRKEETAQGGQLK